MRTRSRFRTWVAPKAFATVFGRRFVEYEWKVPTSGTPNGSVADQPIIGATGSWICATS